jgi:predicted short-subunit dehydrogenase-like oxidoreductase (DUF2520 family)
MEVSVIGAGRVGTALAVLLSKAGHSIVAVSGRAETAERTERHLGLSPVPAADAARLGELVLITTPDDSIATVCAEIAGSLRRGRWVAHASGATGLEALAPARSAGAGVLSIHPLQTFPTVDAALDRIPGSAVAVTAEEEEGYSLGERLARDIGARPFRLDDDAKPLYHAAAVLASNHLVALEALAERAFGLAGIDRPLEAFWPLVRATVDNVETMGPGAALTGPAVRGDAGTVQRNLEAISEAAPEAVSAYVALTRVALDVGVRAGQLSGESRAAVEEVLSRWK